MIWDLYFCFQRRSACRWKGVNDLRSADDILVAKSKKGDIRAFEQLILQYERKVYNLAFRLTGNHDDASDVAQEAFLKIYTSLPDFRGDASFSTWVYRIVSNVCLDELRKRKRQRATSLDEPVSTQDGDMNRQLADRMEGPEEFVERLEVQRTVQAGIDSLDEDYRLVVILRDLQGYSYDEIATIMGCSLGTVKSRLNRARRALKEKFTSLELFRPKYVKSVGGEGR